MVTFIRSIPVLHAKKSVPTLLLNKIPVACIPRKIIRNMCSDSDVCETDLDMQMSFLVGHKAKIASYAKVAHPTQLHLKGYTVKRLDRITRSAPSSIREDNRTTRECKQTLRLEIVRLIIFIVTALFEWGFPCKCVRFHFWFVFLSFSFLRIWWFHTIDFMQSSGLVWWACFRAVRGLCWSEESKPPSSVYIL